MFSACSTPNVQVTVNDILGACTNDCTYSFETTVPEINLQTLSGSVLNLGITDPLNVGFSLNDVVVGLDGQTCPITTGTLSNFNCQLPTNTDNTPIIAAGNHHASVTITGSGVVQP